MTTIPECLAAFSVAAMTNTPDAAARGSAAVDAYLTCVEDSPRQRLAALQELYAAYLELALDSAVAVTIKADIENRIVAIAGAGQASEAADRHA